MRACLQYTARHVVMSLYYARLSLYYARFYKDSLFNGFVAWHYRRGFDCAPRRCRIELRAPLAQAIVAAAGHRSLTRLAVTNFEALAGRGARGATMKLCGNAFSVQTQLPSDAADDHESLKLQDLAEVEVTSEADGYPIETVFNFRSRTRLARCFAGHTTDPAGLRSAAVDSSHAPPVQ